MCNEDDEKPTQKDEGIERTRHTKNKYLGQIRHASNLYPAKRYIVTEILKQHISTTRKD